MQAEARICTAMRKDGAACRVRALPTSAEQMCFAHDGGRQEALKASRLAGGKARSTVIRASKHLPPHLTALQSRLVDLVDELGAGETEPDVARAIVATVGKLLDLAQYSREVGEAAQLEERIAALEELGKGSRMRGTG